MDHTSVTYEDVETTVRYLSQRTQIRPDIAMICGSGLGGLADILENKVIFDFKDIPNFVLPTVTGHAGRLLFGKIGGKCVVCMQGRFHSYEGYHLTQVTFPIRVMAMLGARVLIVTNACGALNPEYKVGDIMVMRDHINIPGLAGANPFAGTDDRFGPQIVATSDAYSLPLRQLTRQVAQDLSLDGVKEGVYAMQVGPCYETVTETSLLKLLGADVAGMSTVPEVIVARQHGQQVLGLSLITNMCVPMYDSDDVIRHEQVLQMGEVAAINMERLITGVVSALEISH